MTAVPLHPARVRIPSLGVDAPVVDVSVDSGGALAVPLPPTTVGWWSAGARPGAGVGTAIIDGHINYNGVAGALAHLDRIRRGDVVVIDGRTSDARQVVERFAVVELRVYTKTALPAKDAFSQIGAGRVALVTCGGPFDTSTGNYEDNIVAYAAPATR